MCFQLKTCKCPISRIVTLATCIVPMNLVHVILFDTRNYFILSLVIRIHACNVSTNGVILNTFTLCIHTTCMNVLFIILSVFPELLYCSKTDPFP